jgi:hypothetical protein
MLAWTVPVDACTGNFEIDSRGEHLADFFAAWMAGLTLVDCVQIGEREDSAWWPFDRPLDPNWKIFGDPFLTRSPQ